MVKGFVGSGFRMVIRVQDARVLGCSAARLLGTVAWQSAGLWSLLRSRVDYALHALRGPGTRNPTRCIRSCRRALSGPNSRVLLCRG